mmetsp:Transcript_28209/g.79193  ORF Transcript_28209/g.79193 Transcript_28209/m.79193 type:complete len:227 (+) Transcript_28209:228-908(+)
MMMLFIGFCAADIVLLLLLHRNFFQRQSFRFWHLVMDEHHANYHRGGEQSKDVGPTEGIEQRWEHKLHQKVQNVIELDVECDCRGGVDLADDRPCDGTESQLVSADVQEHGDEDHDVAIVVLVRRCGRAVVSHRGIPKAHGQHHQRCAHHDAACRQQELASNSIDQRDGDGGNAHHEDGRVNAEIARPARRLQQNSRVGKDGWLAGTLLEQDESEARHVGGKVGGS